MEIQRVATRGSLREKRAEKKINDLRFVHVGIVLLVAIVAIASAIFFMGVKFAPREDVAFVSSCLATVVALLLLPTSPLSYLSLFAYAILLFGTVSGVFNYLLPAEPAPNRLPSGSEWVPVGFGLLILVLVLIVLTYQAKRRHCNDLAITPKDDVWVEFIAEQGPPYALDPFLSAVGIARGDCFRIVVKSGTGGMYQSENQDRTLKKFVKIEAS